MTTSMNLTCAEVRERDLVDAYVADRLAAPEAEAFEAHYFECQACWAELQHALEVKAAFGRPGAVVARGQGRRRWIPLAAAAVVAGVAIGLAQLDRGAVRSDEPVFRGPEATMTVHGEVRAGTVVASWEEIPGAATYLIRLFRPDGSAVLETETEATSVVLDAAAIDGVEAGDPLLLDVRALDPLRNAIRRSELREISLPALPRATPDDR